MTTIDFAVTCPVPVTTAFAYVSDYRNVPQYFHGISSYAPVTDRTAGIGAQFDAEMRLGPSAMKSRLETTAWQENKLLEFTSISGVSNVITYRFEVIELRQCRVYISIEFSLPSGVAGRALTKTLQPFITTAATQTAEAIARHVIDHDASPAV